jgi:hypothetical protein
MQRSSIGGIKAHEQNLDSSNLIINSKCKTLSLKMSDRYPTYNKNRPIIESSRH